MTNATPHHVRKYTKTNNSSRLSSYSCDERHLLLSPQCSLTKLSELPNNNITNNTSISVECSLTKLSSSQSIGLVRIHDENDENENKPVALVEGAILGRTNRKRSLISPPSSSSSRLNIGIPMGATGISRKQIRIVKILNNDNKIEIEVCSNASNAIKICNGKNKKEFIVRISQRILLSIGDSIIFDAYETNPMYVYKLIRMEDNNNNTRTIIRRATKKPLAQSSNNVTTKTVNQQPSSLELINNDNEKENNAIIINNQHPHPHPHHKEITSLSQSPSKLHQWCTDDRKEALICYLLTKSLNLQVKNSLMFWKHRNPAITKVRNANSINYHARKYQSTLSGNDIKLINKEVHNYAKKYSKELNKGDHDEEEESPSLMAESNSEDENVQSAMQNDTVNNKSTNFDRVPPRIKVGTRFRLCSEEKDLFGFRRKQWLYGSAKSVLTVRQDLSQSSHLFEYEIDLKFRDSSMKKVTYPSTDGLQLLYPDPKYPNMIMALTTQGMEYAYDKIPHKICVGDLVDCRMNLRHKFYRGRVADINDNTCCVIFPNNECESKIPLDEKYIICVESGSQEHNWLIGLDVIEDDECIGRIKQANVVENGHALSFDVQAIQSSSKKIVIRTYAEITYSLFLPVLAPCNKEKEFHIESSPLIENNSMALNEQEDVISSHIIIDSKKIESQQKSNNNNNSRKKIKLHASFSNTLVTPEKIIKNMTPIHTSLSNTLFRAFQSDPFNGYEMFNHLVQAKNIAPNDLLKKKYSSVILQESGGPKLDAKKKRKKIFSSVILQESGGPKWDYVLYSEYAMRCSEKVGMDQQNMKWFDFERFLLTSCEKTSNSSSLLVTKTYFALDLFNLVLQQRIDCKLSCRSFFGSDGVQNALKCLSHCCSRFWMKHVNILLSTKCPVNARRCVELFGAICSKLAAMFCINENLSLTHERPLFIIRDSLLEGLSESTQNVSTNNLKDLKLLFILSLDVIHQSNLSKMLSIASELERSCIL